MNTEPAPPASFRHFARNVTDPAGLLIAAIIWAVITKTSHLHTGAALGYLAFMFAGRVPVFAAWELHRWSKEKRPGK